MRKMNIHFLLVLGAFGLFSVNASAAPSVRVLGAAGSSTGVKAASGSNINSATTVKKASVKANNAMPAQQVLKPASVASETSNRISSTSAVSGRLPVITNKNNLQTSYKPATSAGTSISPGITSADFAAMSERIDALESDKADATDLNNYYDKDYIDTVNGATDGAITDINTEITSINARINELGAQDYDQLQTTVTEVQGQVTNITNIMTADLKTIYDAGSESRKMVKLVNNFDERILTNPSAVEGGD